jgi:hypothetical protein
MRFILFLLSCLLFTFSPLNGFCEEETPAENKEPSRKAEIELDYELDQYYSNLGVYIPLTDKAIPDVGESDETKVYKGLFLNSLTPRFMLVEASIFPMPILGTYIKTNHRGFYDSTGFGNDFNFIASVTAGFQEPYSLSLFFGDVVKFVKPGEVRYGTNKGYMGYLFTIADQHIKDNVLINDKSLEIEWKLKGERNFSDEKLSWSFRIGSKLHENKDIADAVYLGLKRSNLDFNSSVLSWLKNSTFDFKWDFGLKDGNILKQEYIIGKKLPLKDYRFALKIDVGMIWQSIKNYSGTLRDRDRDNFTLVFRPNLQF